MTPKEKRRLVRLYIESELNRRNRGFYEKARFIAEETGLTAHEVARALELIKEEPSSFLVSRWGYSKSTTYRISPKVEVEA